MRVDQVFEETNQTVPEKSLCCGSDWLGGHQIPGKKMKLGLRVFINVEHHYLYEIV